MCSVPSLGLSQFPEDFGVGFSWGFTKTIMFNTYKLK